jgi:hypothetical protein
LRKHPTGIIILEGADSSGKTTLANYFRTNCGASYMHGSLHHDFWLRHLAMVRRAVRLSQTRLVVIDRCWLSHLAYGAAYGNLQYDAAARGLDRVLRRHGALYVLCSPRNQARQAEHWAADRQAGKREHYDTVREVIKIYADLREGCLAHPGCGYLDQLIRYQDFCARDDVLVYDMDNHTNPNALRSFAGNALRRLRVLGENMLPPNGENLAGRWSVDTNNGSPRYLFVDASPPDAPPRGCPRWPFLARDPLATGNDPPFSAWAWFNRVANMVSLREDYCVYTCAFSPHADRLWLSELVPQATRVVCLGTYAARAARAVAGDASVAVAEIPHPHRYFRRSQDVEGYARELREALG